MEYFTSRLKALIIDAIIVTLFTALVNNILYVLLLKFNIADSFILSWYPSAALIVVTLLYFTISEAKTNKTIGKKIAKLYVSDSEGYMSYSKAFIRNLTKIYWVPLILDVIIGKVLGFPSRLFDKFAGTDVYKNEDLEQI